MKKTQLILIFILVGGLMAAAGGGAAWWWLNSRGATPQLAEQKPQVDTREYRYVSLDKVIVMLRGREGEPLSHYLALDLVFKTPLESEKTAKAHLPLMRSIAVKAMSAYTFEQAGQMTVDQFAAGINQAYDEGYAREPGGKPFVEAMIGKRIIE